ncbi:MAG: MFS transporter [Gammaproteobacteria bacterium]|nr:MFS transporter [Gammaproteobacteria bacterium]
MKISKNTIVLNSPLIFVELITILLLTYIAYGEGNRKFEEFQLGKMASQAEIIKNALDSQMQAGIPIDQYSGFNTLGEVLMQSDPYIHQVLVKDLQGGDIYAKSESEVKAWQGTPIVLARFDSKMVSFERSLEFYRVKLNVTGKFGPAGTIWLTVDRDAVRLPVAEQFTKIATINAVIMVLFTLFVILFAAMADERSSWDNKRKQVLNIAYLVSFLVISSVIGLSVFKLYESGASAKAQALANAMAQRIDTVLKLNIDLNDVSGINLAFNRYQESNPEINSIALMRDNKVYFTTLEGSLGKPYQEPADSYLFLQQLTQGKAGGVADSNWQLAVTVPVSIVKDAILDRLNEFLVLMLACGLISWIFLDAGTGLTQWVANQKHRTEAQTIDRGNFDVGLKLVKPAYFLIVFTSALPVSFLPQLVTDMAAASATSIATATLPFTVYYFIFAAVLIPAGRYAEQVELKSMMAVGFTTELIGLFLIAASDNYWMLTLGRAFSGFAQGVFLIGLNSYTLSITPRERRTEGAAVKVNGRNAALIAGTAIGALLYAYIDYRTIFFIAVAISLIGILYLWRLVPSVNELIAASKVASKRSSKEIKLKDDIVAVVNDGEFMKTLIFVGLVGKMAITGVIMFAIPLILSERGVASEDIGQSIMLFYVASIVITRYASKYVDATGASRMILIVSAAVGGIGMVLIGITGITTWQFDYPFPGFQLILSGVFLFNNWIAQFTLENINSYIILLGILLAGVSNGMMSAPIMTHIDKTPVAHQYGNKAVAATYLFLERGGHVVGPMVISFMLVFTHNTTLGIALFGLVTFIFSIFFLFTSRQA